MSPSSVEPLRVEVVRHGPEVPGLHRAGASIAAALSAAGCVVDHTTLTATGEVKEGRLEDAYALRVACVNADQFHRVSVDRQVPLVGWWSWELSTFRPAFGPAAVGLTAVWALSEHAARAFRASVDVPVRVLPPPVVGVAPETACREDSGRFQVLVVADHNSGSARKNAAGAVRAYCRAFAPDSGARLVVKTSAGATHPGAARRLASLASARADIEVIDRHLPSDELAHLFACSDVLLSLHRAEGFGLPLAEAMHAGAVVVATAYGGPAEFMTAQNSVRVPYRLARIGPGHWPYPARALWARPDEAAAARELRLLRGDVALRMRIGAQAAQDMRSRHSPTARRAVTRRLVAEAIALGPSGLPRRTTPLPKAPSRWLAGALHHADLWTGGRWVLPVQSFDRHVSRSEGENRGAAP